MAKANDYMLDSDGNLQFSNGDFVVGYSDLQHIADTVAAFPGWWKDHPDDGIGIGAYIKARFYPLPLLKKTREQLESDGYVVINPTVQIVNGTLQFNPDSVRL